MEKISLAIVGYGGMGSYHQSTLIPTDLFQLAGIFDIDHQKIKQAQEAGLETYGSFEALLADQKVSVVLIATPNDQHKDLAIAALQAGKHVICEKPVTLNTAELDAILAVAEATECHFIVHQNRRWDPDFLRVRQVYKEKTIGDLFQIESRVHGANGIPGDWRHVKAQGGGMLLDWGVHLLDQLLFMIDSPIKKVAADLSYVLGEEVDDGFITYLTFANGITALVEVGTTNYVKLPRWYIKGLAGGGVIDDWDLSGSLVVAKDDKNQAPTPIQAGVGLTKTMAPPSEEAVAIEAWPQTQAEFPSFYQNVYDVLVNGASPIVKNHEVRRVMGLMETIFEAAARGEVLDFE